MTCSVYTVRGEGRGIKEVCPKVGVRRQCGAVGPCRLLTTVRALCVLKTGSRRPASAGHRGSSAAPGEEFLRGLESPAKGRVGRARAGLRGGPPLAAALHGALGGGQPCWAASAFAVICSKSCFQSLSLFCFCLQCHCFPLQCLDSQTTFSRENNVLLKIQNCRSQCS